MLYLLLLLLILVSFFAYYYYSKYKKSIVETDKEPVKTVIKNVVERSAVARPSVALNYKEVIDYLVQYDVNHLKQITDALGYEDARINTFDFKSLSKYFDYVAFLSSKANIKIEGISFIDGAKKVNGKYYKTLFYIPTTIVGQKHVQFDPFLSAEKGELVTFKEALKDSGYMWMYEAGVDSEQRIDVLTKYKSRNGGPNVNLDKKNSGAGNLSKSHPPYN